MPIPHLIHVGFPKAGSTFLQEWFTRHPEICFSANGIGGFHDIFGMCGYGAQSAMNEARCIATSGEGLSMPVTARSVQDLANNLKWTEQTIQFSQERVCSLLRTLFPNAQILIVTRGFQSIIQSAYSQLVRLGGTLRPEEMHALFQPQGDSRPHVEASSANQASFSWPGGKHNPFDFDYVIELYSQAFGAENVIVLPFELLRDDQNAFLNVIEQRLGLSHIELEVGRLNPSLSPAELYWYPRISRQVKRVCNRLGEHGAHQVNARHLELTLYNRWRRVIKVLERRWPDKKVTSNNFPIEALRSCRGTADSLRHNALYAPYAADYLWD